MTDHRYEQLYADHHRQVLAYCLRRVDREFAVDLTAEVFAVAWTKRGSLPEGNALPWLYTTARNLIANHHRAAGRDRRRLLRVAGEPSRLPEDPAIHVVQREEDRLLLEALDRLSPDDQEVIRLAAWEELPRAEIAALLEMTPNAVTKRLQRALGRLQRTFAAMTAEGGR